MITKTFEAPLGSGLRSRVVAPEANATGRRITVIVPCMSVFEANWIKSLPHATGIGPISWLRRAADDAADLIIVDCINDGMMRKIRATLESIAAEVWVISDYVGLHDYQRAAIAEVMALFSKQPQRLPDAGQ